MSPDRTVTKAKSTTNLTEIASDPKFHPKYEESSFNTLQDPRLAIGMEVSPSTSSTHHPDLSNEVAALSVKLIQAINNQTTLDDNLVATRQELEAAQGKIKALELENEKHRRDINEQIYIKKSDSDREITQLKAALAEERAARAVAEKGTKTMEQELEALTADLFEEANKVSCILLFSVHCWVRSDIGLRWSLQPRLTGKRSKRRTSNCARKSKTPSLSSHLSKIS